MTKAALKYLSLIAITAWLTNWFTNATLSKWETTDSVHGIKHEGDINTLACKLVFDAGSYYEPINSAAKTLVSHSVKYDDLTRGLNVKVESQSIASLETSADFEMGGGGTQFTILNNSPDQFFASYVEGATNQLFLFQKATGIGVLSTLRGNAGIAKMSASYSVYLCF